jgi:uncharacterized membrane protein YbhN (UPF0104 family)
MTRSSPSASAPPATAVPAVLDYRVVNYWLPLLPGGVAYLRLRLTLKEPRQAKPTKQSAG